MRRLFRFRFRFISLSLSFISFLLPFEHVADPVFVSFVASLRSTGKITSGIPSPTVGGNIGMGYIQNGFHKKGTEVSIMVRKKLRDAVVKAMPFVEAKYYRKP